MLEIHSIKKNNSIFVAVWLTNHNLMINMKRVLFAERNARIYETPYVEALVVDAEGILCDSAGVGGNVDDLVDGGEVDWFN